MVRPLPIAAASSLAAAATISTFPGAEASSTLRGDPPSSSASISSSEAGGPGSDNMNGAYLLSPTPGGPDVRRLFPPRYADYPPTPSGDPIEHFDVYSPPISTLYSQVFWKALPPVPLPRDVVEKFRGKGMAVVGFEVDQVRTNGKGEEVSVPINVAYNHHFESTMIGDGANFREVRPGSAEYEQLRRRQDHLDHGGGMHGHGHPTDQPMWAVVETSPTSSGLPSRQDFGAGNGGEYRKSYHGYAPGYAQIVESPAHFQVTPMMIDTWHRDAMDLDDPTLKFVAGPLPRGSLAPEDAAYSGLLECPATTRVTKRVERDFAVRARGACGEDGAEVIWSAEECYGAAEAVLGAFGGAFEEEEGTDPSEPAGCSATASEGGTAVRVYYNDGAAGTTECGAREDGTDGDGSEDGTYAGSASSLINVTLRLDPAADEAAISLTGPSDVWFGVGFGAAAMRDAPWAIVVDGNGAVTERKLGDQSPGTELEPSLEVISSTAEGGTRTVALKRSMGGRTQDYYSFKAGAATIPFINAVGSTVDLSYHRVREPSSLTVLPVRGGGVGGACVCATAAPPFGEAKGALEYVPAPDDPGEDGQPSSVSFWNHCDPRPRSDLLDAKNPACDLRTYSGGQLACRHMWSLLDADQPNPWPDAPIEYRLKFRFWVQEYDPAYHAPVRRTTWGIASPVEYDVPHCEQGVEGCEWEEDRERWVHTIRGTFKPTPQADEMRLAAAHFHCHAPTCLSVELYVCEEGVDAGRCDASARRLLCRQEPVYGGSDGGGSDGGGDGRFDEAGYMNAQPPCLWGSPEHGLEDPVDVAGKVLHAVKTADAAVGHHGEMAWLQVYYF